MWTNTYFIISNKNPFQQVEDITVVAATLEEGIVEYEVEYTWLLQSRILLSGFYVCCHS